MINGDAGRYLEFHCPGLVRQMEEATADGIAAARAQKCCHPESLPRAMFQAKPRDCRGEHRDEGPVSALRQPCALCAQPVAVDRQWQIVVCTACMEEYGDAAVQNWMRGWLQGDARAAAEWRPRLNNAHENLCQAEKRALALRRSRGDWKMLAAMGWWAFLLFAAAVLLGS